MSHSDHRRSLALAALLMGLLTCSPPNAPLQWHIPCSVRTLDVLTPLHIRYAGSDGWVGQTLDGGKTWEHLQWTAPDGSHPSFRASGASRGHWHAVGIASPSWMARTPLKGLQPEWTFHDTASSMFLDAMTWIDGETGVVLGDDTRGCMTLMRSIDEGASWDQVSCADLPKPRLGEAAFAASNGNLCAKGDTVWAFTGGASSRVFRSLDRGASWNAYEMPIVQGGNMTGAFSATFADARLGWAMGGDWSRPDDNYGNLVQTLDGGETWSLLAEGEGPGYRSSIVHHPKDCQVLVASGFAGLECSTDSGVTWQTISDSGSYVVRFAPDGLTLWLAGNESLEKRSWPAEAK